MITANVTYKDGTQKMMLKEDWETLTIWMARHWSDIDEIRAAVCPAKEESHNGTLCKD